jgi:membrane-associated phospholipid phosphatase
MAVATRPRLPGQQQAAPVQAVRTARRETRARTEPKGEALRRGRMGLGVAVLAFLGFAAIFAVVRANRTMEIDLAISMRLQKRRNPWLAKLMEWVSWPGFPPQSRLIPSFTAITLFVLALPLEAAFLVGAWLTALLSTVVKAVMKRPRPEHADLRVAVGPLGGSSFPSGHTITFVGVYGFLAYLAHTLIKPIWPRRLLTAFFGSLVALVGPSRIYQGHHWPTDVTASYLLGTSYLIALVGLYRRFKARHTPPPV